MAATSSSAVGDRLLELFDHDEAYEMEAADVARALRSLGKDPTPAQVDAMVARFDADGSGTIDYPEFCALMTHEMRSDASERDQIIAAFHELDTDGNGGALCARCITTLGPTTTDQPF